MRMVSYKLYQRLRISPTNWPISTLDADACYRLMVLLMSCVFIMGIYVVHKFLELKKYCRCISWKVFPIFGKNSLLSQHWLAWYIHGIEKCTSLQVSNEYHKRWKVSSTLQIIISYECFDFLLRVNDVILLLLSIPIWDMTEISKNSCNNLSGFWVIKLNVFLWRSPIFLLI